MSDREDTKPAKSQLDRRQVVTLGAGLALTAAGGTAAAGSLLASPGAVTSPADRSKLFAGIDHVLVLCMENRSFDHYFGTLRSDPKYPAAATVNGLKGSESNTDRDGNSVTSYHLDKLTQVDPPHGWEPCHEQWNGGKNDGFVRVHDPEFASEVMGYFDRSQLPFSYWLADNFTLCDSWFAGVLGPTWPNRTVLHATTAGGLKENLPILNPPTTLWEAMTTAGKTGKNYYGGPAAFYAGAFLGKLLSGINPTAGLDEFFSDAAAGTLPNFAIIDPDFTVNDDHPSHNVHLGQAFIASVYNALTASPQWSRSLLIITYDEHGGFYDHVPPPTCRDDDPEYRQLGFRVPTLVVGPTVKQGALCSSVLEHCSVGATLRTCFGIENLTTRMATTSDIADCIDPAAVGRPRTPPPSPPVIDLAATNALSNISFHEGQPELAAMVASGEIPARFTNERSHEQRLHGWLQQAEALGAVKLR